MLKVFSVFYKKPMHFNGLILVKLKWNLKYRGHVTWTNVSNQDFWRSENNKSINVADRNIIEILRHPITFKL